MLLMPFETHPLKTLHSNVYIPLWIELQAAAEEGVAKSGNPFPNFTQKISSLIRLEFAEGGFVPLLAKVTVKGKPETRFSAIVLIVSGEGF